MTAAEAKKFVALDKNSGYFKYVQMKGGEYRFTVAAAFGDSHKGLADGGDVVSAGFVIIRPLMIKVEGYSTSLKIGPAKEDYERIPELFR